MRRMKLLQVREQLLCCSTAHVCHKTQKKIPHGFWKMREKWQLRMPEAWPWWDWEERSFNWAKSRDRGSINLQLTHGTTTQGYTAEDTQPPPLPCFQLRLNVQTQICAVIISAMQQAAGDHVQSSWAEELRLRTWWKRTEKGKAAQESKSREIVLKKANGTAEGFNASSSNGHISRFLLLRLTGTSTRTCTRS